MADIPWWCCDVWRDGADQDDEVVDERIGSADGRDESGWVSIAAAAAGAGVATRTVRHWYRHGRLETRRRDGDRGGFLVEVDRVRELAAMHPRVRRVDDNVFPSDLATPRLGWRRGPKQPKLDRNSQVSVP